ncbi:MAG: reverse transcriptase domain-containing protein [Paenirhodobacter sp.]|uniref:reverse transcriptase domain-containing protein n=1 Tax=Paenirhodobacter sp. TaxID=1965326 RepID=UPI003D10CD57
MSFSITSRQSAEPQFHFREEIPILFQVLEIVEANASCPASTLYSTFETGRHGSRKSRTIDAPCPQLKAVQRALLDKILCMVSPHEAAMAFCPGRSIAMNARLHHGAPHLFTTDIRSFFPSIRTHHLREMLDLRFPHLSAEVRAEITRIVTRDGQLPQGAPTSPHLANLVMASFDGLCEEAASSAGALYTRYADDICITAQDAVSLRRLEHVVRMGLAALGMEMHPEKTRHLGPNQTRLVTGLDIGGARLRPTKAFRKKTAALVRMAVKYPEKMQRQRQRIRGYLAFWHDVDADDPHLRELLLQMGFSRWAGQAMDRAEITRTDPSAVSNAAGPGA